MQLLQNRISSKLIVLAFLIPITVAAAGLGDIWDMGSKKPTPPTTTPQAPNPQPPAPPAPKPVRK